MNTVSTSRLTYNKKRREFVGEASELREALSYSGFWLQSQRTGKKVGVKFSHTVQDQDRDSLYFVFVPSTAEGKQAFDRVVIVND